VPDFKFNAKELDEENGMYYFEHRYHAPPTFISRDRYFEKLSFMSPYSYCNNNPVVLIDPNGDFPFGYPQRGVSYYSFRAGAGIGFFAAVQASYKRGIATDRHGMTHFSGYSTMYVANQKLAEGPKGYATDRTSLFGIDVGVAFNYGYSDFSNSFIEDLSIWNPTSNSFSIFPFSKSKVGLDMHGNESNIGFGVGAGLSMNVMGERLNIIESISLSPSEAVKAGEYNHWEVSNSTLKFDEKGSPFFEGQVVSGIVNKTNTGISVISSAEKKDGKYVPTGVWISKEYLKSLNKNE
jgi:RHS repeat-associated protein